MTKIGSVHDGHRERTRDEFRKNGLEHFPDHKKMEMLLFYAIPRGDTNELGHRLVDTFGSISGVLDAPYELLCDVNGLGRQSATLIKFVSALIRAYMDDCSSTDNAILTPADAIKYLRYKFLSEQRECLYMACMGNNGRILFCGRIADGTPETVSVVPMDIVKTALRVNAVKAVLAHNHPNGICNPSSHDLRATSILFDELQRVDIELIDHVIIAPDGAYSMRENNMFPSASY